MSLEALQKRLSQLEETHSTLRDLIDRLSTLKFQPGSVPLSNDPEDNPGAELSGEISAILREETDDLDLLREEVADLPTGRPGSETEHSRKRLDEAISRLEADLKKSHVSFRRAQLAARDSLLAAQKQEKHLLLASYAIPPTPSSRESATSSPIPQQPQRELLLKPRHRRRLDQRSEHSATVNKSADVTAALRQTHALIVGEVARSDFAAQTLAESTAALGELSERYTDLGGMLKSSRALVGNLLRVQKSDTWYLETAFWMLVGTAGWLLYRRLLYGPLMLFVWWPLRLLFGAGWRVGSAVGGLAGGRGREEASMVVDGGGQKVVGITEGSVPTVSVAGGKSQTEETADPDSMMEKVGKIVDEDVKRAQQGEGTASGDAEDGHNTDTTASKDAKAGGKDSRIKDEL